MPGSRSHSRSGEEICSWNVGGWQPVNGCVDIACCLCHGLRGRWRSTMATRVAEKYANGHAIQYASAKLGEFTGAEVTLLHHIIWVCNDVVYDI